MVKKLEGKSHFTSVSVLLHMLGGQSSATELKFRGQESKNVQTDPGPDFRVKFHLTKLQTIMAKC